MIGVSVLLIEAITEFSLKILCKSIYYIPFNEGNFLLNVVYGLPQNRFKYLRNVEHNI